MKLDSIDRKILNMLQENARLTNKELAANLGLSITPVYERVKKLEKQGYIRGYVAILDPEMVERGMTVFVFVQSLEHGKERVQEFMDYIHSFPEVMECYHVGGEYDFLIKAVVRDMKTYERFLLNKLTSIDNIRHVKSTFVLSHLKHRTSMELEEDAKK